MRKMKYDLHIHSKYSSDGILEPKKIVKIAIERGLDGIAITDHNTIKGGLEAKTYETRNFKVIIGSEIKTERGEIIGLFLSKEIKSRDSKSVFSEIKKQDGIVVIPHPFDELKRYAFHPREDDTKMVDCIEGFNSRCVFQKYNDRAIKFGKKYNLTVTAGSDAHFSNEIGNAGIITESEDIRKALMKNEVEIFGKISPLILVNHIRTKALKIIRHII